MQFADTKNFDEKNSVALLPEKYIKGPRGKQIILYSCGKGKIKPSLVLDDFEEKNIQRNAIQVESLFHFSIHTSFMYRNCMLLRQMLFQCLSYIIKVLFLFAEILVAIVAICQMWIFSHSHMDSMFLFQMVGNGFICTAEMAFTIFTIRHFDMFGLDIG